MTNKLLAECLQCVLVTQAIFVVGRFYSCVESPEKVDFPVSYYSFNKNDCFQNHEQLDPAVPQPVAYATFETGWTGFDNLTFKTTTKLPRKKRIRSTKTSEFYKTTTAPVPLLRKVILDCLRCVDKAKIYDGSALKCIQSELEKKDGSGLIFITQDQCVNFFTTNDSVLRPWEYTRRIPRVLTTSTTKTTQQVNSFPTATSTRSSAWRKSSYSMTTVSTEGTKGITITADPTKNVSLTKGVGPEMTTTNSVGDPVMTLFDIELNETTETPTDNNTDDHTVPMVTEHAGLITATVIVAAVLVFMGAVAVRLWLWKKTNETRSTYRSIVADDEGIELQVMDSHRNSMYAIPEQDEEEDL